MTNTQELTTLVCLFHHQDQAHAAIEDLRKSGIPESAISIVGNGGEAARQSTLEEMRVPERDMKTLVEGVDRGGIIVGVAAYDEQADTVEAIFERHAASEIDERTINTEPASMGQPVSGSLGETTIPVIAEELVVGKRTVERGGVRVFRRLVERPVEESIQLREEHVIVERNAVNRPVTQADLDAQNEKTIELIEMGEDAVVGKTARVVEEVIVGKDASERTEQVHDTVRNTVVEVEELTPDSSHLNKTQTY